jgi:hypothetical protein
MPTMDKQSIAVKYHDKLVRLVKFGSVMLHPNDKNSQTFKMLAVELLEEIKGDLK